MSPSISGYTTTYNPYKKGYPVNEVVNNLLSFCNEVCIADGGSNIDEATQLAELSRSDPRIKLAFFPVDLSHPLWAIELDGHLKAKAREMCSQEICWQADIDEFIDFRHRNRISSVATTVNEFSSHLTVFALPVIEFWGALNRVRMDVGPKPRVSYNHKDITHGIPIECREYLKDGTYYPKEHSSDSCDYIHKKTGERLPVYLINGSFNTVPVWHVSWLDFERKIRNHRDFWCKFERSMNQNETSNTMFSKPWSEVTDDDVKEMALKMHRNGPRFFHNYVEEWTNQTMPCELERIPQDILNKYYVL